MTRPWSYEQTPPLGGLFQAIPRMIEQVWSTLWAQRSAFIIDMQRLQHLAACLEPCRDVVACVGDQHQQFILVRDASYDLDLGASVISFLGDHAPDSLSALVLPERDMAFLEAQGFFVWRMPERD
jgi:hypothetical protein